MDQVITVYVSIGNSDDKLTQARWATFCATVADLLDRAAGRIHGAWLSAPASPWQNACWCIEVDPSMADWVKPRLSGLAGAYEQDSIAWAVATTTFLTPDGVDG